MAERASDRLLRLLGMIAYLDGHDDVAVDDLAAQFGVSAEQVLADVDTLWVTGTPGYLPYDLIDFDATAYERGVLSLVEARGMARPLRLGGREAVALVAALRAMAASLAPALDDERAAVLHSALAKVTAAAGDAAAAIDVQLAVPTTPQVGAAIGDALARGRRLAIRYVDAGDRTSEREVDPIRLLTEDERTYLLAWCRSSDAERLFRVDRVVGARVLDAPVDEHRLTDRAGVFAPEGGEPVTLHLASQGRWIAESAPAEAVRDLPDGSFEVDLRVVQPAWLRHLLLQGAHAVLDVRPAQVAHDAAAFARRALDAYAPLLASERGD
ncbi:MAG: WYL domain-containing protein [Micrococcales bacterium]|nr:WYL domain-containing protein [Micrococcales bacterium]